ncbi:iron complex transport system substrate-binding protein [Leucobacter exalbidus]|uniref:Iron complex transport system substrate-binding protein n=1 Tax=Leucobacter exalbidus TaxID=662960 RepID=A0A940T3B9_9MICO|nr:ABC transporter substrate-binding protein [Leucobacter exalbidus]MBP1325559.1 iron complex transport system substrate-binding protein [Leucobacter exalbidus]
MRRVTRNTAGVLVLGLAAAALLGGCSAREAVATAEPSAEAGGAKTLDEPIVVTDQRGVTHTFTEPIEKIATTVIPAPSMLTAIDQSYDRIVGINESTIKRDDGSVFATMFPGALTNTVISGSDFVPNVETIAEIDPDVVIQWADQGDSDVYVSPIEDAGYPVIGLEYGTQKDLEAWIEMFSTLLGQEARGEELLERMHGTIADIEAFAAKQTHSPTTIFLRSAGDGGYNAGMSSTDAYMNTWMTMSGATNVAAGVEYQTASATSIEQILEWDPEVIFTSAMSPLVPADIYADPALAGLQAVQNKRIYAMPSGGFWWDPPSAESTLSFIWATQVLYPETASYDLRAEMVELYEFLYGYTLTDDEIDDVLRFDINGQAANYDQFER